MSDYTVSINGEFVARDDAKISVFDHGFLFGDSVYEVVRTVDGKLFAARPHLERLRQSADRLMLPLPWSDDQFIEHFRAMHAERDGGESYLRVIVTRGEGVIDLHPESCATQNVIGVAKALTVWPREHYVNGAKVILADVRRNDRRATDPAIKSGNYLNNVLALIEARREKAQEAVMLNASGHVTECTTSNIFIVKDDVVVTPELTDGLLQGITRRFVIEVCRGQGLAIEERSVTADELKDADEAFLTSTTRDVMPIGVLDDLRLPTDRPVTRQIMAAYQEVLHDASNLD